MFKKTSILTMIISIIFIQQLCLAEFNMLNGIWVIDQEKTINELTKYQNENKIKELLSKYTQPLAWQCMIAIEINDEIVSLNSTLKKELINSDKKTSTDFFLKKTICQNIYQLTTTSHLINL